MYNEEIIGVFPTEIRTKWDHIGYIGFITNHRTILTNLKVSSSYLVFGPIGILAMQKKAEGELQKLKDEANTSLNNILKTDKKSIEIRYDKIIKIEYKHGKKWEPPILIISYAEPLRKSKNQINLAILPNKEYLETKKAEGIKGGKVHIEFSKDFLNIINPIFKGQLTIKS